MNSKIDSMDMQIKSFAASPQKYWYKPQVTWESIMVWTKNNKSYLKLTVPSNEIVSQILWVKSISYKIQGDNLSNNSFEINVPNIRGSFEVVLTNRIIVNYLIQNANPGYYHFCNLVDWSEKPGIKISPIYSMDEEPWNNLINILNWTHGWNKSFIWRIYLDFITKPYKFKSFFLLQKEIKSVF